MWPFDFFKEKEGKPWTTRTADWTERKLGEVQEGGPGKRGPGEDFFERAGRRKDIGHVETEEERYKGIPGYDLGVEDSGTAPMELPEVETRKRGETHEEFLDRLEREQREKARKEVIQESEEARRVKREAEKDILEGREADVARSQAGQLESTLWERVDALGPGFWEKYQDMLSAGRTLEQRERAVEAWESGFGVSEAKAEKEEFELALKAEELEKKRFELGAAKRKSRAGMLKGVLTAGGIPMTPQQRRELYFGRAKKDFYTPSAPTTLGKIPAGEALRPGRALGPGTGRAGEALRPGMGPAGKLHGAGGLDHLRRLTMPGAPPQGFQKTLNLGVIKEMMVPRGWTRPMAMAYEEIRQNHDVDSPAHVVSELTMLGVPRSEAVKAIGKLLALGFIQKMKDPNFPGEPELQVVKEAPTNAKRAK